jgi:hypothetical protein
MASLRDLVRMLLPLARPVGGGALDEANLDREVFWVRQLRAREPALDSLEAGDLVLVPTVALAAAAPDAAHAEALGDALARARVAATVIVDNDGGQADQSTGALGQAASRGGVTVLRTQDEDVAGLERSVIGFIVNRRAELDRRAGALEAQLARMSLGGHGLDRLAAAIGGSLGRAVAIEGRRGDPIAIHTPAELASGAAAVSRYLAKPSAAALRIQIPAPADEPGAGGRLVLLGDEPPTEMERIAGERIAALLALELARDAAVRQAREQSRRAEPLPADGPPWVVVIARQVAAGATLDPAAREETRAAIRQLVSARRLSLRGTSESIELRLVAAAPADDPEGLVVAGRIASFLGQSVAISTPFADPAERPTAEAAARTTLEAIEALEDRPTVARASRLAAYRLLANLRNLPDGQRQARELLAPLLIGRESVQAERLRTLQAVLESGSLAEAAARLGVHRNTIAYRVARLEDLGRWDLADPDLRVALTIATRALRRSG